MIIKVIKLIHIKNSIRSVIQNTAYKRFVWIAVTLHITICESAHEVHRGSHKTHNGQCVRESL